jgi:hypothetical protein
MDNNTVQGLPHVEATLNYLAADAERPVSYAYTPPPGTPQTTRRNSPHTVTIRNGIVKLILTLSDLSQYSVFGRSHDDNILGCCRLVIH